MALSGQFEILFWSLFTMLVAIYFWEEGWFWAVFLVASFAFLPSALEL
ncbi:MAG: hypothetical protein Ct9H300mP18_06890 [Candidatus Neomarinimicrobiota bacterium]|nr:MAG: hypothetical protein Ct9H300mP18_06890 [Candidatus Neomarinimicrobiota bacterium]